jgi:hypothetical protein
MNLESLVHTYGLSPSNVVGSAIWAVLRVHSRHNRRRLKMDCTALSLLEAVQCITG